MAKILTGSTLSYGSVLPDPFKTADGSMFFLTAAYVDPITSPTNPTGVVQNRTPGLHIFSFQQDSSTSALGDQVGQQWKQVSSLQTFVKTTGDTMTGTLTIAAANALRFVNATNESGGILYANVGIAQGITLTADGGPISFQAGGNQRMLLQNNGNLQLFPSTGGTANVWTNLNDGPASGMDADLLDSQDGPFYLNSANHVGVIPLARGGTSASTTTPGGIVFGGAGQLGTSVAGVAGQLLQSGATGAPTWINPSALTVASAAQLTTARNITLTGNATGSASFNGTADATISVSVNNSAALQGRVPDSSPSGNTVVLRDANGYTFASYFNSSSPNNENVTVSQFVTTNGADNFYRKASVAHVANVLGLGNYVLKSGDSMTGQLNVNGINLIYSTNSINVPGTGTFGAVTVSGGVSAAGVQTYTGGQGGANLIRGGGANTGYIDFTAPNGNRQGYIGYATTNGGTDTGTISFVMAQANFSGNVVAYSSDGRLKKNVTVIENAMDKIATLGGYSYDWDMEKTRRLGFYPTNEHEHGLIAQEVQKVLPDAVCAAPFNEDYLTVKYERLVALLVAGMNEQQAQINALMSEVEELKNQR